MADREGEPSMSSSKNERSVDQTSEKTTKSIPKTPKRKADEAKARPSKRTKPPVQEPTKIAEPQVQSKEPQVDDGDVVVPTDDIMADMLDLDLLSPEEMEAEMTEMEKKPFKIDETMTLFGITISYKPSTDNEVNVKSLAREVLPTVHKQTIDGILTYYCKPPTTDSVGKWLHAATSIIVELDQYLCSIFPDKDVRDFVLSSIAIAFFKGNIFQKMYTFHGRGGDGKTMFGNFLVDVFGDFGHTMPASQLQSRIFSTINNASLADIQGKRVCFCSEPSNKDTNLVLDESTVKLLTGGERITAQAKYKNASTFDCSALILLSTNTSPVLWDLTHGSDRRQCVIPFENKFVSKENVDPTDKKFLKDMDLVHKMQHWKGAMAYRLVERFISLQGNYELVVPLSVEKATTELMNNSPQRQFVSECIALEPDARVLRASVGKAFEQWKKQAEWGTFPRGIHDYLLGLKNIEYHDKKNQVRIDNEVGTGYRGVRLNELGLSLVPVKQTSNKKGVEEKVEDPEDLFNQ
ncbi:hypothetical protein BC832DRAFT_595547 [Gaertneriomyces semiglobifer]|nr:hypothetical protein BC832DRAFT_595547 [Gaertneriomyces semiglobifer]